MANVTRHIPRGMDRNSWITLICVALVIRSAGNIFQPAISYMAHDLGLSQVAATTNLTLYYLCLTVSFLLTGPLCDRYPKNTLIRIALAGCLVGSVGCAVAHEVWVLNLGRSIQAVSGGLGILCAQTWIGNHSTRKNMMKRLAWFSMIVAMAPILAPIIGGIVSDLLSWRYDFWLIVLLCIAGLAITVATPLYEPHPNQTDAGNQLPHSHSTCSALWSIIRNYNFIIRRLPVLRFSVCVLILYMGQSMFVTISSFLFINTFGITASGLGFLCGIAVGSMLIGRFITPWLAKHLSIRTAFLLNEALIILSSVGGCSYYLFNATHTLFETAIVIILQSIGFSGLAIISMNNVMLVGGAHKGTVSGLYNFMNQGCSWLGVLLAQFCYGLGMTSVEIFQLMTCIVPVGSLIAILLFIKAYSKYQNQLEQHTPTIIP